MRRNKLILHGDSSDRLLLPSECTVLDTLFNFLSKRGLTPPETLMFGVENANEAPIDILPVVALIFVGANANPLQLI